MHRLSAASSQTAYTSFANRIEVNICLRTVEHEEHPNWDWKRYPGDRDIVALMRKLPSNTTVVDHDLYVRPADFTVWRKALSEAKWPKPDRFGKLLDLLEAGPDYRIYVY